MAAGLRLICLFALVALVASDCYMHNPRGSNNRLNERSANRNNANRLFDSQNNNRGGYNAGDQGAERFNNEDEIYYMKYFQSAQEASSYLTIEWTNQHGCGGREDDDTHKLNCNLVIQYMVQDYDGTQAVPDDPERAYRIRNGDNTGTQNHQQPQNGETFANYESRRQNNVRPDRGLHESFDYYDDCVRRERNEGLFTADQNLRGNTARFTRQNPNGNRRGYECPEERDYYPYWHPTPWRDIAVLTDNTTLCESIYQTESFNVAPRQICKERFSSGEVKSWSEHNNQADCEDPENQEDGNPNPNVWFTEYAYIDIDTPRGTEANCVARNNTDGYRRVWYPPSFGEPSSCLVLPNAPECVQGGWSRDNHLGNSRDGVPLNYTWRIPYFPSGNSKIAVVRIRYNISTDDYQPWTTDYSSNDNPATGQRSPVEQNPNVNIGSTTNKPLRLAINTAQFGRTFQDRTHVMELRPRSALNNQEAEACTIHNLNVRGKRGNIVQTYPAVEYDFVPNRLTIDTNDCIHFQWTGSNTHNNGAPGGDGQTGDAGEGTGGTDRTNIVETPCPNCNYPIPFDQEGRLFRDAEVLWSSFQQPTSNDPEVRALDLAVAFASAGYYHCFENRCGTESVTAKTQMNQLLNNAPASFEGAVLRFSTQGNYYYMCSRNNNFTNRSQKGQLTVRNTQ